MSINLLDDCTSNPVYFYFYIKSFKFKSLRNFTSTSSVGLHVSRSRTRNDRRDTPVRPNTVKMCHGVEPETREIYLYFIKPTSFFFLSTKEQNGHHDSESDRNKRAYLD